MAVLDYRAPSLAAKNISSHFVGDREAAVVLDVACGTGLVAKQVNSQDGDTTTCTDEKGKKTKSEESNQIFD